MREIKFRLIKDGKIVGYEQHVVVEGEIEIQHKLPGNKHSWHDIRFEPARFIHHDSKDIFIGQKNKNGKDIYEGDKLDFGLLNGFVVFSGIGYSITSGDHGYVLKADDYKECEIIGNIHDTVAADRQTSRQRSRENTKWQ